jgi:hypothetical protein
MSTLDIFESVIVPYTSYDYLIDSNDLCDALAGDRFDLYDYWAELLSDGLTLDNVNEFLRHCGVPFFCTTLATSQAHGGMLLVVARV